MSKNISAESKNTFLSEIIYDKYGPVTLEKNFSEEKLTKSHIPCSPPMMVPQLGPMTCGFNALALMFEYEGLAAQDFTVEEERKEAVLKFTASMVEDACKEEWTSSFGEVRDSAILIKAAEKFKFPGCKLLPLSSAKNKEEYVLTLYKNLKEGHGIIVNARVTHKGFPNPDAQGMLHAVLIFGGYFIGDHCYFLVTHQNRRQIWCANDLYLSVAKESPQLKSAVAVPSKKMAGIINVKKHNPELSCIYLLGQKIGVPYKKYLIGESPRLGILDILYNANLLGEGLKNEIPNLKMLIGLIGQEEKYFFLYKVLNLIQKAFRLYPQAERQNLWTYVFSHSEVLYRALKCLKADIKNPEKLKKILDCFLHEEAMIKLAKILYRSNLLNEKVMKMLINLKDSASRIIFKNILIKLVNNDDDSSENLKENFNELVEAFNSQELYWQKFLLSNLKSLPYSIDSKQLSHIVQISLPIEAMFTFKSLGSGISEEYELTFISPKGVKSIAIYPCRLNPAEMHNEMKRQCANIQEHDQLPFYLLPLLESIFLTARKDHKENMTVFSPWSNLLFGDQEKDKMTTAADIMNRFLENPKLTLKELQGIVRKKVYSPNIGQLLDIAQNCIERRDAVLALSRYPHSSSLSP